jgi:hypothetical protein
MKRAFLVGIIMAAFCALMEQTVHAEPKSFAMPPKEGRQVWFLDMLKNLADTNDLTDPIKVGAILGVKFNTNVVTKGPSHMEAFAKSFERDEYTPAGKTWFMAGEPGYASTGGWKPNGGNGFVAGIDPRAKGRKVNFKYFQSRRFGLDDNMIILRADIPKNDSQTTLIFYGIDKLACITLHDIQSFFPGIHHMDGTDASAERYLYYPSPSEESGNVLSFEAPEGKCVTEATVNEFSGFGKRIKRATLKFAKCMQDAGTEFCKNYPEANPQTFRAHVELRAYLHESCGSTLDAYYQKEPSSGEAPQEGINYFDLPAFCPYPYKG